jgi:hypothetical protein
MGAAYRPLPILSPFVEKLLKNQHVGWAKRSVPIIFIYYLNPAITWHSPVNTGT